MMSVAPNLTTNLNHLFQKAVYLNDLQYDYYSKYLAAACKSQTGPEVVVLSKEAQGLNVLSSFQTEFEPVFLSWAPPTFGNMLVVVLSDSSVRFFKNDYNCTGSWKVVYQNADLSFSVSSLSVGVSPDGELLVGLGSLTGSITVLTSHKTQEVTQFFGHNGGVSALSFNSSDGSKLADFPVLLASGGMDNCVKLWEFEDNNFKLEKTLKLDTLNTEGGYESLQRVNSLCWSKQGELAVATESFVFLFEKTHDWTLFQTVKLNKNNSSTFVSFNNDRIVLLQDSETVVLKRNDSGSFDFHSTLSS